MKKFLAIVLIICMVLTVMVGCKDNNDLNDNNSQNSNDKNNKEETNNNNNNNNNNESKPVEKTKLSLAAAATGPVDDDSMAEKAIEEAFPEVDWEFVPVEIGTYMEQMTTLIAGGDVPDIMSWSDRGKVSQMVEQGVLGEVPFELVKENMPEWWASMEDFGKEAFLACYLDGKNYGLPVMNKTLARPMVNAIRQDWMENVGVDKVPETLDEVEDLLRKFTFEDPDQNGENDTYGMTLRGKDSILHSAAAIYGAYGVFGPFWFKGDDGKIVYGLTTPEAKMALTKLNQWYEEGLIDPEFVTTDWSILKQKFYNGKIGYFDNATYYRIRKGEELYEGLKAVYPDAEILPTYPPVGPDGESGHFNWGKITGSMTFSKSTADDKDKLALALRVVNKIGADNEFYTLIKYGIEGEHWEVDADNGGIVPIPPYNEAKNTGALGNNLIIYTETPESRLYYTRKDEEEYAKYGEAGTVKNGVDYFTVLNSFIPKEYSAASGDTDVIAKKAVVNFITGSRPMDEFEDFVQEWMEAGGEQLTKGANEGFEQYDSYITDMISSIEK